MRFHLQQSIVTVIITTLLPTVYTLPANSHLEKYPAYDYGGSKSKLFERQSSGPIVTTGVKVGVGQNGSLPLRIEIREMQKDTTMWTLYLLGLDFMQRNKSQSDMESWYQVAGIHGRPYKAYDNVQALQGNEANGYCTHVSIIFPPWHRPYLALYEQILYNAIQVIAQQYPEGTVRNKYVASAANFRIPYWDWAAVPPSGESVLPSSVSSSATIAVDGPRGTQNIWNPLYSYSFQPLDSTDIPDAPFNVYQQTMRYPTTSDQNAVSQNNLVAQQLDNSAATFRSRLYTLLTNYHNYSTFSNEAWINSNDNPNNYDSIESLHDQIHGLTGSGGHMGYIEYSAFDPIFWLHHAMVDRCFALWETLNPNTYVVPEPARYNSFTTRANSIQDINTPLTPFHKDASGAFWTSADVHDTSTFGYAYRETASYPGQNVTANVISAINTLYGPGAISSSGTQSESKSKRTRVIPTTPVDLSVDGLYTEWIANIKVKKYALGVPFFIHIFIGPFDPDPFSWSFESNLVGTHSIFVKAGECNCDTEQMISATIPLTDALAKHFRNGDLESLSPKDVNAFLTNNGTGQFQYRITFFNDTAVANGDVRLSSLKIGVLSSEVQMPAQVQDLPQWGPLRGRFEITTG